MSSLFPRHLLTSVSAPIFLQNICVHGRNAGIIIHEREVTGHLIPSQYIYQKQSSSLDFGIEFWNFQIILVHVRFGSLPALDFSSLKCAESLPHFVLMIKLNLLKLRSLHNSLPHQEVLFSPLDEIWCREQLKMNLEKKASSKRVRYCKKVNIYGHTVHSHHGRFLKTYNITRLKHFWSRNYYIRYFIPACLQVKAHMAV